MSAGGQHECIKVQVAVPLNYPFRRSVVRHSSSFHSTHWAAQISPQRVAIKSCPCRQSPSGVGGSRARLAPAGRSARCWFACISSLALFSTSLKPVRAQKSRFRVKTFDECLRTHHARPVRARRRKCVLPLHSRAPLSHARPLVRAQVVGTARPA